MTLTVAPAPRSAFRGATISPLPALLGAIDGLRGGRPADLVDIVDGVEEQQVLHVGIGIEDRRREGRLCRDRGKCTRPRRLRLAVSCGAYEPLSQEAVEKRVEGRRDLAGIALVPLEQS